MNDKRAIIPPSLLGIEQSITYVNRKYWLDMMGVIRGFAVKLSGSLKINEYK